MIQQLSFKNLSGIHVKNIGQQNKGINFSSPDQHPTQA
jgi:hypothetical protein